MNQTDNLIQDFVKFKMTADARTNLVEDFQFLLCRASRNGGEGSRGFVSVSCFNEVSMVS
jgi:hypothetical protein